MTEKDEHAVILQYIDARIEDVLETVEHVQKITKSFVYVGMILMILIFIAAAVLLFKSYSS